MAYDMFGKLSSLVADHDEVNRALREKLALTCDSMSQALAQNTIYYPGNDIVLAEGPDDMVLEGHFAAKDKIHFYFRSSEDFYQGDPGYSSMDIRRMPLDWVRKIIEGDHLHIFINMVVQKLEESTQATRKMMGRLDSVAARPAMELNNALAAATERAGFPEVYKTWKKALENAHTNPDGAINHACSMLETACKHILSEMKAEIPKDGLVSTYKALSKVLELHPDNRANTHVGELCRGLVAVVQGVATLRNAYSEAHGTLPDNVKVSADHARLTVDSSGTLAIFLMEQFSKKAGK